MKFSFTDRAWQCLCLATITLMLAACGGGSDRSAPGAEQPVKVEQPVKTLPAAGTPSAPAGDPLVLPLEVLGNGRPDTPVIAQAALAIPADKLASAAQLWFRCHRCGFYGAPEFEATTHAPTRVKASVRVLGGAEDEANIAWVDVTDASVTLADDERLHGGVNGGLYTTRITVALDAATRARLVGLPRTNRIQFRFNGTDGESNGFRVLDVQLRDAYAARVDTTAVRRADPQVERAPGAVSAGDIAAGKALWYAQGSINKSSIVPRRMQAACASCHARDGRDLQYFNYSNNAIVQRSLFHGLSENQGRQIVAYLRASLEAVPYVPAARPWNPPYQPGPGLDGDPAAFAAGAGLEAVLDTPVQAMNALFGKPSGAGVALSQDDIDRVMDASATMNTREIAVPMQFPDWNAWLPTIHPLDAWPTQADGSGFAEGARYSNGDKKNPNGYYASLHAWLDQNRNPNGNLADWSHLTPDQRTRINAMFTQSGWEGYSFLGGGRGNHIGSPVATGAQVGGAHLQSLASAGTVGGADRAAFTTNAFIERAMASMLHWNAVKQWELAQEYQLEGNQRWFIGDKDKATGAWKGRGEARGWPFNTVSLFYLAPHMVYQEDKDGSGRITREWYTAWEAGNVTASFYRSNQWYQLQMTVNPGGQSDWVNFPMDWPYLTEFDHYIALRLGDASAAERAAKAGHYIRLLQARIKSAQYVSNDLPLYDPNEPFLPNNRGRYGRAQVVKHLAVSNYLDNANRDGVNRSRFQFLDDLAPGLYVKVVNGAIRQFTGLYAAYPASAWRRCDPANTDLGEPENISGFRFCLDQTRTPLGTYANGDRFMVSNALYQTTTEQTEQYGLWQARRIGADPARIKVWQEWADAVWR